MSTTSGTNGDAKSILERLDAEAKEARAEAARLRKELHDTENRARWAWQKAAREGVGESLVRATDLLSERIAHAVQDKNGELIDDLAHVLRQVWISRWEIGLHEDDVTVVTEEPEPDDGEASE